MTPKKKKTKSQSKTHRKRYGTLFNVGQVLIILGAVLIIVSAIVGIVQYLEVGAPEGTWQSYTFGFVNIWLAAVVAIIVAVIVIWLAVDRRIYYRMNLYLYAIIIIIIALLAGNLGSLVVILGALIIIFYRLSKS